MINMKTDQGYQTGPEVSEVTDSLNLGLPGSLAGLCKGDLYLGPENRTNSFFFMHCD